MVQVQIVVFQVDFVQDKVIVVKFSNVCWCIFVIVFVLMVINLVDWVLLFIVMFIIVGEFQFMLSMQGLIFSSFFWVYVLLQIFGGWLIDCYGLCWVIGWFIGFWGVFQIFVVFVSGGLLLMFVWVVLGVVEVLLFFFGGKFNLLWLGFSECSCGVVLMDCGGLLGVVFGGLVIVYLIVVFGFWCSVFFIVGIVILVMVWLVWYYLCDDLVEYFGVNVVELDWINVDCIILFVEVDCQVGGRLGIVGCFLVGIVFGCVSWVMVFFGLLIWGFSYLVQVCGFDIKGIGVVIFVIFFCGVVGFLFGGFFCDLLICKGVCCGLVVKGLLMVLGFVVLVVFLLLLSLEDVYVVVILLVLIVFFLMWGSLYWSFLVLFVILVWVGLVGGVMNMVGSFGGIVVLILVGLLL